MHTINFSLDFFAERICTEPEKLSYCVIQRTYNNPEYGCCRFPGLCVEGLGEYVYSLTEGNFVRLGEIFGDSIITVESAMIEAVEDGYIFRTASGCPLRQGRIRRCRRGPPDRCSQDRSR